MSKSSPRSLLFLSVDCVAKNYRQLCKVREVVKIANEPNLQQVSLLAFSHYCCLPSNICELLLQRFMFHYDQNWLLDYLTLFTDPVRCPLKRFSIANVYHKFYDHNLYVLIVLELIIKCQNLLELDVGPVYNHILLNTDFSKSNCVNSLKKLMIFGAVPEYVATFWSRRDEPLTNAYFMKNFSNLKHLCFDSCLNMTDNGVSILAAEMQHLESLDLSSTSVSKTHVFDKLKTKLKVLILHNTPLSSFSNLTDLLDFSNLCHLDISQKFDIFNINNAQLSEFFSSDKSLPYLAALDISGSRALEKGELHSFLDKHKSLHFLGLLDVHHRVENEVLANFEVIC